MLEYPTDPFMPYYKRPPGGGQADSAGPIGVFAPAAAGSADRLARASSNR